MDLKNKIYYSCVSLMMLGVSVVNVVYEHQVIKCILVVMPSLLYVPLFFTKNKPIENTHADDAFDEIPNVPNMIAPENTPYNLPEEFVPTKVSSIIPIP